MYKVTHHVEDYFMPIEFGKNNYGAHKVDCNKIICVFFGEDGKPKWELYPVEKIMKLVGYELPKNKNLRYVCKQKFQRGVINAVNWLCEEHGLNVVQIKISAIRKVCYGFTKELQSQADNIDRKIERRNNQIEQIKNRKNISNQKALKLIKNEEDRVLLHRKVV